MDGCKVTEDVAEKLLVYATEIAQERMERWCKNTLKRHSEQAEQIYSLLKKLKADPLLPEIEKKVLELCIKPY